MLGRFSLTLVAALVAVVQAGDRLTSIGSQVCQDGGDLQFQNLDASFDRSTRVLNFNLSGASTSWQRVKGVLSVQAYGKQIWQTEFDPCDQQISALCPVPAVPFMASGNQTLPEDWANKIPSITYSIPDVDGLLRIQIINSDNDTQAGCIQAPISNGKTVRLPVVQYTSVALVIAALLLDGLSPDAAIGTSPSFAVVISWLQSLAMNGMLSVDYPPVYRAFTSNFAFATGMLAWPSLQRTIDDFRNVTGGNTTYANYGILKNTTLVFPGTSSSQTVVYTQASAFSAMLRRQLTFHTSDTDTIKVDVASDSMVRYSQSVSGIQAYAEQISIPGANTFLTFLVVFVLMLALFIGGALLLKVVTELYRKTRSLPRWLESWRLQSSHRLSRAIGALVMSFYGVWIMLSLNQIMNGDSWTVQSLAALSAVLFTVLLAVYSLRISHRAHTRQLQHVNDRDMWTKFGVLYDSFKQPYWWFFIPVIVSNALRGAIIAGLDGAGILQVIGGLAIESALLAMLVLMQPFQSKNSTVVNIIVQLGRLVSMLCIGVFVDSANVDAMTRTIVGFTLVVIQSAVTILLAGLLLFNAVRFYLSGDSKQQQRGRADMDARYERLDSSMLEGSDMEAEAFYDSKELDDLQGHYDQTTRLESPAGSLRSRRPSDAGRHGRNHSDERLISNEGEK